MNSRYAHLLSPIRVRDFVLKNRMINSQSISQELQGPQIYPDEPYQRYTTDYAKNGAAMVNITIGSWPDSQGRHDPMDQFYMEDRKVLNAYAKQIDRIHAYSSLVSGNVAVNFGRTQISEIRDPSLLTFRGDYGGGPGFVYGQLPEVTPEQMRSAIAEATRHAAEIASMGVDCINIHIHRPSHTGPERRQPGMTGKIQKAGGEKHKEEAGR